MRAGQPRRPGKAFGTVGGAKPPALKGLPGPPGPAILHKRTRTGRGQIAHSYPADVLMWVGRPFTLSKQGTVSNCRPRSGSRCMLCKSASGAEIGLPGQLLAGLQSGRSWNRPSDRPLAGRRAPVGAFPVAVRPKCCVTSSTNPPASSEQELFRVTPRWLCRLGRRPGPEVQIRWPGAERSPVRETGESRGAAVCFGRPPVECVPYPDPTGTALRVRSLTAAGR